jgi:membrane protein DedA with SNARE-associated domain
LLLFDVGAHLVAIAGGTCRHRQPSGLCTQRTEVNVVPTIAYGVAGAGAIVGAVLWYVLGDTGASEEQRVQVSFAPDMLSVAAHF